MKRIYLQRITQHNQECYLGAADPRTIVRIAQSIEVGEVQDAQRPLSAKRVKEIAKYVEDGNGILPNTLTIATKDDRIKICPYEEDKGLYYIELPSTNSEFEKCKDAIDVMDGQHRLYSFLDDYRLISDSEKYEIGFTLYSNPSLKLRRTIFVSCNEKQEKVSGNLLLWFRKKLDMISGEEERLYDIVSDLSNMYPLKGHVIMSAEKVPNGVKAKEIIAELKKIGVLNFSASDKKLDNETIVSMISKYLIAWQDVAAFNFSTSKPKEAGVAVKMAGLRFMLELLPAVWDYAISSKQRFDEKFLESTIKKMIEKRGVSYEQFFLDSNLNKYFRDRTMTQELAAECSDDIKKLGAESFNPLA